MEDHLKLLIVRNFDPKKADLIFTEEGSVGARKPNTPAHYTQACVSRGSLHIAHMHTHLYTHSTLYSMHASIHPCIHTSMHTCIHTSVHTCIHTSMPQFACVHIVRTMPRLLSNHFSALPVPDAPLAGRHDQLPLMEGSLSPAGRTIPGLSYAQVHHQAHSRHWLPGPPLLHHLHRLPPPRLLCYRLQKDSEADFKVFLLSPSREACRIDGEERMCVCVCVCDV